MSQHEDPQGFEGDVVLEVDGEPSRTVPAVLAARFDPLAGHVVWSGRVSAAVEPRTVVVLTTPHGSARAQATERDVWGNTRVTGIDRPPFPVELLDGAAPV